MKTIIISDLHIDKGIKINICIDFLNYIESFNIKNIVIAGDIFEKATKIYNDAFIPFYKKIMDMKNKNFIFYFLLGNHDIYNDNNNSLVETFSPFGHVIQNYFSIENIDFYSFTDKVDLPNKNEILITHLPIATFNFDNNKYVDDKMGYDPKLFSYYKQVFSGHFHNHQKKNNIVYIGSPYQLNFGEEGQEKGFIILNGNNYEFIKYDKAPIYKTIDVDNFQNENVKNCFVAVKINKKIENFIKLKHLLFENGALDVKPIFVEPEQIERNDIQINMSNDIKKMLKEYILSIDNVNTEKLLFYFDEVNSCIL